MKKYTLLAIFALSFISMIGAGNVSAIVQDCPRVDIVQFNFLTKPGKEEFLRDTFPGWTIEIQRRFPSYNREKILDGSFDVTHPGSTPRTVCKYHVTKGTGDRQPIVAEFTLKVKE